MAYASVGDLQAGWKELTDAEKARAEVLLSRASALIDSLADTTKVNGEVLTAVCCSIVQRVMCAEDFGISQANITAGSYTQSYTYSNPAGDMYLTKTERKMLGIGSHGATMYKVAIHDSDGEPIDW